MGQFHGTQTNTTPFVEEELVEEAFGGQADTMPVVEELLNALAEGACSGQQIACLDDVREQATKKMPQQVIQEIRDEFELYSASFVGQVLDGRDYRKRLDVLLRNKELIQSSLPDAHLLRGEMHSQTSLLLCLENKMMDSAREMDKAKQVTRHRWLIRIHVWEFEKMFSQWLKVDDNVASNSQELHAYMCERIRIADELARNEQLAGAIIEYCVCLLVANSLWKSGFRPYRAGIQPVDSYLLAKLYTSRARAAFILFNQLSGNPAGSPEHQFWIQVLPTMEVDDLEKALDYSAHSDVEVLLLGAQIHHAYKRSGTALGLVQEAKRLKPDNERVDLYMKTIRADMPEAPAVKPTKQDKGIDMSFLEGTNVGIVQMQNEHRKRTMERLQSHKGPKSKTAMKRLGRRSQLDAPVKDAGALRVPARQQEPPSMPSARFARPSANKHQGHGIGAAYWRTPPGTSSAKAEKPDRPAGKKSSHKALEIIQQRFDNRLACVECMKLADPQDSEEHWTLLAVEHTCKEDILVLRPQTCQKSTWYKVKRRPNRANLINGLCEAVELGERCKERPCPYPHNEGEQVVWSNRISVDDLVADLKTTSLGLKSALGKFTLMNPGEFHFLCRKCTSSSTEEDLSLHKKERHQPSCKEGHSMEDKTNKALYFIPKEGTAIPFQSGVQGDGLHASVNNIIQKMTGQGFKLEEIVEQSKKCSQHCQSEKRNQLQRLMREGDRVRTASGSSQGSYHSDAEVPVLTPEDIVKGYEEEVEWLMTHSHTVSEEDADEDDVDYKYGKDMYYEVEDNNTLLNFLETDPDRYKHCVIRLEASQKGHCTTLDGQEVIEIRGRMNCGPSFEGDEVVVEVMQTPELDKDTTVTRGKVVGILKRRTNRKAHIFVCTVDQFFSNLMVPTCGTCPKVHVVDSYIREHYGPDTKNNYVDVYNFTTKLELKKVVKIDPAKKEQLLFIVKYLKWDETQMYPLGYVFSVIPAGRDMRSGQTVINLMYQVPGPHSQEIEDHVENCAYERLTESTDGRTDLTDEMIFSIDPPDAQDVDDALSVSKNRDGTLAVGVHIADVSAYVLENDPIDLDARKRATSFYAADRNMSYPMLPSKLSHDLCSLHANKNRCAISVLFTMSDQGEMVTLPAIKKTLIRSRAKLTYIDAQECISSGESERVDPEVCSKIRMLHELAQKLREARLGEAQFFVQTRDLGDEGTDAHRLVEDFMILANRAVAGFLVQRFGECIPLRKQDDPRPAAVDAWRTICQGTAERSFYFRCFADMLEDDINDNDLQTIPVLNEVIEQLSDAVEERDVKKVQELFGAENFHPQHAIALVQWYRIQNPACFVAKSNSEQGRHFSLQLRHYTQFTSPIRRYMDIVVHRMVTAALNGEENPYTPDELDELCGHVNTIYRRAKKHSKASEQLRMTAELMGKSSFVPGIISEVTDGQIELQLPNLPHQKAQERTLCFSQLDVAAKPDVSDDAAVLTWQKRIYDARGFHPHAKRKIAMNEPVKLNPFGNVGRISADDWDQIQQAIIDGDQERLLYLAAQILTVCQAQERRVEVTSEMKDMSIVKHHASFSWELRLGSAVQVQMVAECRKGLIQPIIRLLKFTPECDVCIQHAKDPVGCFAEVATNKLRKSYGSIAEYQKVIFPILNMEAACNSVSESDPIIISNAQVSLTQSNGKYYGKLKLAMAFCKPRHIKLLANTKEEDSDSNDFMCIRCPLADGTTWVGHAVHTKASTTKDDDVVVEFRVHHMNEQPPRAISDGKTTCHLELLSKNLPDRRMENAVKDLMGASELCKKIVLGHQVPPPDEKWKKLCPKDLDIHVDSKGPPLPKNNDRQNEVTRKALTERFTLIQGPPGTGKTVTGIKLAYWFCQLNAMQAEGGKKRRQVLYCGPSNSAVDVAARLLREKLGNKCPKIMRVYSEMLQNQVYPIPRDVAVVSKRNRAYQMLSKEGQKPIALHFLIRQDTNTYHAKILGFDKKFKKFRKRPEEVTDEEIEAYQKLVTDASMEEIAKYDIILCTCAVSASPVMVRAANITQIIIDECGMCMEPESIIPMVAHKATEQVVLVGDHRQLRPIVKNATAQELGLERSLFERYWDKATMLDEQYRMHGEICAFPSNHFYGGKLRSPLPGAWVKPSLMVDRERHDGTHYTQEVNIWPNPKVPLVFCHVEGAEKILTVSTEEGNERSRSNEAEIEHATRIYRVLVNDNKVPQDLVTVLTQYKAQSSEIQRTLTDYGFEKPRVSTVVASQGDEWDYVILSTVRSLPKYEIDKRPSIGWLKKNLGFIIDHHQINVALTRAKRGLIIVGNQHLLRCDPMWQELLDYYRSKRCLVPAEEFLQDRSRKQYRRNVQNAEAEWRRLSHFTRPGPPYQGGAGRYRRH